MVERAQRHVRTHPCPVCGGRDEDPRGAGRRCGGYTSADGLYAHCSRPELAAGIDPGRDALYAHRLHGSCKCGVSHGPAREAAGGGRRGRADPEAVYRYRDERGDLVFEVLRMPGKRFLQRRPCPVCGPDAPRAHNDPDCKAGWLWSTRGTRMVPYRLPELLAAGPEVAVWVVEGEKDADAGAAAGLLTTCNPRGAGKWAAVAQTARGVLRGRSVVVVADRDAAGVRHAAEVADSLRPVAASVRLVRAPAHKDLADHLAAGGSVLGMVDVRPGDDVSMPPPPGGGGEGEGGTAAEGEGGTAAEGGAAGEGGAAAAAGPGAATPPRAPAVAPPAYDRPVVRVTTQLHTTITQAIDVLASDRNLFARDGALVDVVRRAEVDPDAYLAPGAPKIRLLSVPTVRERLTRAARWEKVDARAKPDPGSDVAWAPCIPPDNVVAGVLARGEYPGVRPIVGVLEAPSMRPDGSLIVAPGYDPRTGYLYEPAAAFPDVPDAPSQADAARAARDLFEPFADFPFASEPCRAAAVAAILTILARPAVRGAVPAFLVSANTRGTGKSLATDVVGVLATGRSTAKMSWPDDDVELEKVLGGYALRGAALVNFDNVTRPFGGGPLDRCLTATDSVELRVLGKSEVPEVLWRAVVLATGNNLQLTGDTARRSLLVRLESPLEHPEDRDRFAIDRLVDWCRDNRPRLVAAALTVLRAWHVAGRPLGGCRRWGSFEAWSEIVPPALVFAGAADPMGARPASLDEEEPEKAALVSFLQGMQALDRDGRGMSAAAIVKTLFPPGGRRRDEPPDGLDSLREAVEEIARTRPGVLPSATALGYGLRRYRRRVVGGYCLDSRTAHGVAVWFVSSPTGRSVTVPPSVPTETDDER